MAKMTRVSCRVTVTAGGVVQNDKGQVLVVSQRGSSWSLPKGHVDPAEEPLDAAVREIREESGVEELSLQRVLGAYGRYKIGLNSTEDTTEWKVLFFYLFTTKQRQLCPQDPNNPQARWVDCAQVADLLTHPKDKSFYTSILPLLNRTA